MAAKAAAIRNVPIDMRIREEDPDRRGNIQYMYNTPSEPVGVFSFTWYYRHDPEQSNKNVRSDIRGDRLMKYLEGLLMYIRIVEDPQFAGWKVVLYTDQNSIDNLEHIFRTYYDKSPNMSHKNTANYILSHPKVIVAICSWPEYYTGYNDPTIVDPAKKIDGVILRVFRTRAFCDFHGIPVFVRDADTIFPQKVESTLPTDDEGIITLHKYYIEFFTTWEHAFLENHRRTGLPFLVTSYIGYHRPWHYNRIYDFNTIGFFAGLTNSLGGLPQWNPEDPNNLWLKSIDFIRERSTVTLSKPTKPHMNPRKQLTNINERTYVGKDEQIISFVWLPELVDSTFFFYMNIGEDYYLKSPSKILEVWDTPPENAIKQNKTYKNIFKGILKEIQDQLPERSVDLMNLPLNEYLKYEPIRNDVLAKGKTKEQELDILKNVFNDLKAKGKKRANYDFNTNFIQFMVRKKGIFIPSDGVYIMNETFRDPLYNIILRTFWMRVNAAYQRKKVGAGAGGRRRTIRKRHMNRRKTLKN